MRDIRSITIRLDKSTVAYFKELARELGMPLSEPYKPVPQGLRPEPKEIEDEVRGRL